MLDNGARALRWLRRLYAKGTENGTIEIDRVQFVLREACERCFPGIYHYSVDPNEWRSIRSGTLKEIQERCRPKISQGSLAFQKSNFKANTAEFKRPIDKPSQDDPNRKTCRADQWGAQTTQQLSIMALQVDADGCIRDWSPVEKGWMSGFIENVHSGKVVAPTVLVHREALTLHLVMMCPNCTSVV